ncbi:hypothetical protein QTP88_027559 [Uroleucon formosanum]
MCEEESLKKRAVRAQTIVDGMCLDDYNNTITAFTSLGLMLVVVVLGTAAVCALTLNLDILYVGLTMIVVITDVVWSPTNVQVAVGKCFPGAVQWINCGIVSRCSSVFSAFGRRAIAALVVGHWGAVQVIGTCMFVVVDLLRPSHRPEERTPLEAVGNGPTANVVQDHDLTPADPEEKPSVAKADTTEKTFKYWKKRFTLFSMFDKGYWMKVQSFYSVCPEVLASYMAKKCGNIKVAVDPFCGAGGNVIRLAKIFDKVIAMDIDPEKILLVKHNSIIYEVFDKIEFIVGDFFTMPNQLKGDVIVTSPLWGGPDYNETPVIGPLQLSLYKLLAVGKIVAPKVLLHLPKNIDKFECLKMCNGIGAEVRKVENMFMDRYLNSTLLYVRSNNVNGRVNVLLDEITITEAKNHLVLLSSELHNDNIIDPVIIEQPFILSNHIEDNEVYDLKLELRTAVADRSSGLVSRQEQVVLNIQSEIVSFMQLPIEDKKQKHRYMDKT